MKTALIINPRSRPKRTLADKLMRRESVESELARHIEEVTGGEVTTYHGAETLDEVPDQVVVYGGDGSVMMAYNQLLRMTGRAPPILIAGGGSGTYWTRNLGIQTMRPKDRIALLKNGRTKSFPLIKVEYDGMLSPHDVSYADSFGVGDLASWIHDAETIKGEWKSSQKGTPIERATYIFLSYILAGADYITHLGREYTLKAEEEYATIHGSILPLVGLGIRIYNPGDGFAVQSTPIGPNAHLTTLIEMAGHIVGLGDEEVRKKLSISTEGTVPLHFNGTPFVFKGESITLTYEPNKVTFFCP